MAKTVLTDVRLFTAGADLSGVSNRAEISTEAESKEVTNFRSGGVKEFIGGLRSSTITAAGQWEAGDAGKVDNALWSQIGGSGPWTLTPGDATVGALAYFTSALETSYSFFGGGVGEVADYNANAVSTWPVVRGQIANALGTARTATGTGTAIQLGAVAAGQHLYAALHVISVSGTTPSATFRIESDDASGFASPTTRLTFTAATAAGGQIIRVAGPITDTWFRAGWTISGTSPSFLAIVAMGVA